jgi:signal transduction histidine kinase
MEHNAALIEKSDREGFVDTPAWRQFFLIATKLKDEINGIVEGLRRAHAVGAKRSGPSSVPTAEAAIKSLARDADLGRTLKRSLVSQQDILEKAIILAEELPPSKRADAFAAQAQRALQDVKKQAREPISTASAESAQLLKNEIQNLRSQVRTAYDFIAAGMAAETLAHEVHPLLDQALQRIAAAEKGAKKAGLKDVSSDLQGARAYLRLIGKQLSMLNPMLKVYRETKDTIDVEKFLREYKNYVSDRLTDAGIKLDIITRKPFHAQLPRGRLMQVIDNLVRNSEYWLQVPAAKRKIASPQITIEIRKPLLVVADNGLGVRPELEGRLFEMFVSDKPKDFGRGLGLFITREILTRYGCDILLSDDTNSDGRRFRFVIDLSAAIG